MKIPDHSVKHLNSESHMSRIRKHATLGCNDAAVGYSIFASMTREITQANSLFQETASN